MAFFGIFRYAVTTKKEPQFLRITATGKFSVRRSKRLWERVATEGRKHGAQRFLVDLRGIVGAPNWEEEHELALHIVAHVRLTLAVVVSTMRSLPHFSEWLVVKGGVEGRAFNCEPDAIAWLLPDSSRRAAEVG